MKSKLTLGKGLRVLFAGLATVAFAAPAAAQNDTTLVIDGNVFFDSGGGSVYSSDSGFCQSLNGGLGGILSTTSLSDSVFTDNIDANPLLTDPKGINSPDFSPTVGSPVLADNGKVLKRVSDLDPWFQDVCYAGAVPPTGGDPAKDWTKGWTYYNYDGGFGRTDIDTTRTSVVITTRVQSDTTWTNTTNIVLIGRVAVDSTVTLTIEPGTVILGSGPGTYLVVERGGKINAVGTAAEPIIFTSGARWQDGDQFPGDWGGLVIHGSAVANCAPVDTVGTGTNPQGCGITDATLDCLSEGGAGSFGRDDDSSNEGIMRYARVEYAGQEIAVDNELNAFTWNAVGSGTTMEYLQAHLGTDDLFEWFGGVGRARYLVGTGGQDDGLDWQMGYRGMVQFAVIQKQTAIVQGASTDSGIEADNNEFDNDCGSRSAAYVANVTLVGAVNGGGRGARFRRGTAVHLLNSVVMDFPSNELRVEGSSTFANCPGAQLADLTCNTTAANDPVLGNRFVAMAAPNPTAAASTISFQLPASGNVKVQIFDVNGRLVQTVADGPMTEGSHNVRWDARDVTGGMYFYAVVTDEGERTTGKIVVQR